MLIEGPPHHVHLFYLYDDEFHADRLTRLYCYQLDCYAKEGPSLSREMYPPEVIGPKLMIAREE